jgi:SAM-dependent methyltransferase
MNTNRSRWESRYASRGHERVRPPSVLLARHLAVLPRGRALDLACGDGRHALALARQGFAVDAVDIAFAALARLLAAAQAEALAVHPVQADLERFPLPVARYAAIVNVRHLQRTLYAPIRSALVPGGVVVFETFLREQARFGHPKNPAFLLEPGELRAHFAGFEILEEAEGLAETEGGPAYLARLVARRPAQSDLD